MAQFHHDMSTYTANISTSSFAAGVLTHRKTRRGAHTACCTAPVVEGATVGADHNTALLLYTQHHVSYCGRCCDMLAARFTARVVSCASLRLQAFSSAQQQIASPPAARAINLDCCFVTASSNDRVTDTNGDEKLQLLMYPPARCVHACVKSANYSTSNTAHCLL
jgi:hypothetical protein